MVLDALGSQPDPGRQSRAGYRRSIPQKGSDAFLHRSRTRLYFVFLGSHSGFLGRPAYFLGSHSSPLGSPTATSERRLRASPRARWHRPLPGLDDFPAPSLGWSHITNSTRLSELARVVLDALGSQPDPGRQSRAGYRRSIPQKGDDAFLHRSRTRLSFVFLGSHSGFLGSSAYFLGSHSSPFGSPTSGHRLRARGLPSGLSWLVPRGESDPPFGAGQGGT